METVSVRMSRGDRSIAWGFGVTEGGKGEVFIVNVVGGSLADRAGLQNGDEIHEVEGLGNLDIQAVDRLLVTARDHIQLVVLRQSGGQTRIWKPEIRQMSQFDNRSSSVNRTEERPFRVSLEHSSDTRPPEGFNSSALPFNADPRVKHLQYNSPMGLYSNDNVVESYAQQTAGIVDSQVPARKPDEPAYLRSETLRLLKEQEGQRGPPSISDHPNPQNLPVCFICTRRILGVMARAAGHDLHADCFSCATCGNSLKNVGHHFLEDKFYCDIHGRMKKGLPSKVMDPNLVVRSSPTAAHPVRVQEPVRSPYQPEVMSRGPVSPSTHSSSHHQVNVHVTNPKTQGIISPQLRGVPTNAIYGDRLSQAPEPIREHHNGINTYQSYPPNNNNNNNFNNVNNNNSSYSEHKTTTTTTTTNYSPVAPALPTTAPPTTHANDSYSRTVNNTHKTEIKGQGALTNPGGRVPICEACKQQIRGAFVLATGLAWCPEHFVCANNRCGRRLLECGFVEEQGQKYCETCFESYIAPRCNQCSKPIVSDCLNALQKKWHPTCFTCAHCHKPFGNSAFYLENGQAYCETDWNKLFTTKCVSCSYPIEAGDRWVEALSSAFHSNCFNCSRCHVNLEGESFFAKNGQPFCKMHA